MAARLTDESPVTLASLEEIVSLNSAPGASDREISGPLVFVMQWEIARRALGRAPSTDEFADFWGASTRTVYRSLKRFREAFPGELDPDRIAQLGQPRNNNFGWRAFATLRVPVVG